MVLSHTFPYVCDVKPGFSCSIEALRSLPADQSWLVCTLALRSAAGKAKREKPLVSHLVVSAMVL